MKTLRLMRHLTMDQFVQSGQQDKVKNVVEGSIVDLRQFAGDEFDAVESGKPAIIL